MNIDWSKAPEWAVAHGLHETGFGIKEFWLGETQHQNLEHAKSFPYGGGDPSCGSFHNSRRESFGYVTPRPTPWTGEGLPPVGTECESMWNESRDEWFKAKVFGVNEHGQPIFRWEEGVKKYEYQASPLTGHRGNPYFRPIRTPEQIALEERDKVVSEMTEASLYGHYAFTKAQAEIACRVLYDAGYRKFEIVDGE